MNISNTIIATYNNGFVINNNIIYCYNNSQIDTGMVSNFQNRGTIYTGTPECGFGSVSMPSNGTIISGCPP